MLKLRDALDAAFSPQAIATSACTQDVQRHLDAAGIAHRSDTVVKHED